MEGTILDLNGRAYNAAINYLKEVSIRGEVVGKYLVYQIAPQWGRGIIKADPHTRRIELTDTVDRAAREGLLHATKQRAVTI